MVWTALLYAIVGTWITSRIGRPLVQLNFEQQRYEADFRFGLVRFRENAESVALYHGETAELRGFQARFGAVVRNFWEIMRRQKRLTWFTAGYAQAAVIFPIVVAAPRYFRGAIHLGGLIQTATAFGQVQDSLGFIVSSYTDIATWRSVVERLVGFERGLAQARSEPAGGGIAHLEDDAARLDLEGLELELPDGQQLIGGVNLSLARGDTVLLGGRSGTGKSTLIRAVAGIWPFGRGVVRLPLGARILVLPQKPYLPIGTLRDVVRYPGEADDATLREALAAVELPELARPDDSMKPTTGRCGSLRASSSGSPSRVHLSRNPTGSSSTRRPRHWTRRPKHGSTGSCASGSPTSPCSAWATGERFAPSTLASSSCDPKERGPPTSWT